MGKLKNEFLVFLSYRFIADLLNLLQQLQVTKEYTKHYN